MADEWFRTSDWDAEAQVEFERRLQRARPMKRIQYLRIKGLALRDAGLIEDARMLWTRVLELPDEYGFSHVAAIENLAESWVVDDPERAEELYRELVYRQPTADGTSGMVQVALAELLLNQGGSGNIKEATDLLNLWEDSDNPFPKAWFRYALARVQLAEARADIDGAQSTARTALRLANLGPQFPRHGPIGVVETDELTVRRLKRIAGDDA